MLVPEQLYVPSPRDQHVTWLEPVHRVLTAQVAAALVNQPFVVPDGRLLILTNIVGQATAGAAQTINQVAVQVVPPNNEFEVDLRRELAAAATTFFVNWTGHVWVQPDWQVKVVGAFSAGANPNTVGLLLSGILVPVANVQRI